MDDGASNSAFTEMLISVFRDHDPGDAGGYGSLRRGRELSKG